MIFPLNYIGLKHNSAQIGEYKLVPIRYQDRFDIMKWRNEQMFHLRQMEPLNEQVQESYFTDTVAKLFVQDKPTQYLFSYMKNEVCIGYGGLVHIDWSQKKAEVSFIMDTKLEELEFDFHWSNYLKMIKKLAFDILKLHAIFTYAYDLRPHLYPVLEKNEFILVKRIKEALEVENVKKDALVHECQNPNTSIKVRICEEKDLELVYGWSNDELVRSQSFNSDNITFDEHSKWFLNKISSKNSLLLINENDIEPIGLVRFEVNEGYATIGIMLDKNYRGKGLSSVMLVKSCAAYFRSFSEPIKAYIKENNVASSKAFEKAGFVFVEKYIKDDFSTLVYKLESNE